MSSEITTILYDHYKDTCVVIGGATKRRDRAMLLAIAAAGFFALQAIFPSTANLAVVDFLHFKFGLSLQINLSLIGNIVWLLVLLFSLRYFQAAVFVERQYAYIHKLEEKLNDNLGSELITREGKSYLAEYPLFSDWMWALYTIVFPLLLFYATFVKILGEWANVVQWDSFGLIFNTVIFVLLSISVALYLVMLHVKKKRTSS